MASHIENKAKQLRDEGLKKLNSRGFFQSWFGGSDKASEAIDYYTRAGNLFKMAKNWQEAGEAFRDAGDLNCKTQDDLEAALNYSEAGNCFRKYDTAKAVQLYTKAIKLYSEMGRFFTAAKIEQKIAELMEELEDFSGAMVHYELASDLLHDENHHTMANKCMQKVGEFAAIEGKYQKAIKVFQGLAGPLLTYTAIEYFFRACICHLCNDPQMMESVLIRYQEAYPKFKNTREYHLIITLLDCMAQNDMDRYANEIRIYDGTGKLSNWHMTMLLRAKSSLDYESLR
ncbi:unnamed protein product [Ceutorhynchus assimilis]|uniref:Alpha-soluble NSF attachment protein n=1 Tax=Ceutorhynchus assimilis TaxID=467358 RepID=A0A9N9QPR4_9CUCU|nr:unnamed protein product [Ceutorhynchus assimilis]